MLVIHDPDELASFERPAFVPTMGALHAGHEAMIRRAAASERAVVVSVFVNPTQFGPGEDFQRYPRDLDRDVERAKHAGADVVFAPEVDVVYPPGEEKPRVDLPAVAMEPGLEDRARPGHFRGVCQVVTRLFDLVRPSEAFFGEKDFQQLRVMEAIVEARRDRWPDLRIVPHPTVREPDGLAMSSRNVYLSHEQRERALGLSRALALAQQEAAPGRDVTRVEERMRATLVRHHLQVDYAAVRDARTLMPIDELGDEPARALIAARCDDVRLIDNALVGGGIEPASTA